ncbi:MAG: ankyrin repeat domain-containing protein, partial [Rickettsiales bacterium]|nr:ankyrin repeat domain-containing protein [Rickettsiales bacterium]
MPLLPRIIAALLLGIWVVSCPQISIVAPSFAEERIQDETARSEFVYRVNLGRADDVRLLMRQGASANQLSGEGVPVICLAAGRRDPEGVNVIHALLQQGANINARDKQGQTPLFYAAKSGNLDSITYLLDNNADSYALDNNGDVARTAAYRAGQNDAVRAIDDFILQQTAKVTQAYRKRNRELAGQYPPPPKPKVIPSPGTAPIAPEAPPAPPPAPVPEKPVAAA